MKTYLYTTEERMPPASGPRVINFPIIPLIKNMGCWLLALFFMAVPAYAAENPPPIPLPETGAASDKMLQQLTVEREPITEDVINIHFHKLPTAEYIGFIVALKKGFYQEAGLPNVSLQWPDSPDSLNAFSLSAHTPFCVKNLSAAIVSNFSDLKSSVRIAQLSQRSDLAIVTMASAGITRLSDLNYKIFQTSGGDSFLNLNMLLSENSIIPKKIFSLGQDPAILLNGLVDACVMPYFDEYHTLLQRGVRPEELNIFRFHEHGMGLPGNGVDTLPLYLKNNPEICQAVIEATIKGYFYAFSHRKESLDSLMSYMERHKSLSNRSHQTWMLEQVYQTYTFRVGPDPRDWGRLNETDYNRAVDYIVGSSGGRRPDMSLFYSAPPRSWDKPEPLGNTPDSDTGAELEN